MSLAGTLAGFRASFTETEETYVSSLLIYSLSADCSCVLHKEISLIVSSVASRMTSLMSSKQWSLLDEMRGHVTVRMVDKGTGSLRLL